MMASLLAKDLRYCAVLLMIARGSMDGQPGVVWKNLGPNECMNLRGQYETCHHLEYCSDNPLHKGCRKCSEISQSWCDHDLVEFRKKFPSCEVLCEKMINERRKNQLEQEIVAQTDIVARLNETVQRTEQQLRKTEAELNATGTALAILERKNDEKDEKVENLEADIANMAEKTKIWFSVMILLIIVVVVLLRFIFNLRQQLRTAKDRSVPGTASRKKGWWRSFPSFGSKKPRPQQPVSPETNGQESQSFIPLTVANYSSPSQSLIPLTVANYSSPSTTCQPSDSGHCNSNNTSNIPNSSNSTLSDAVAPSVGTQHHPNDQKDFMTCCTSAPTAAEWV